MHSNSSASVGIHRPSLHLDLDRLWLDRWLFLVQFAADATRIGPRPTGFAVTINRDGAEPTYRIGQQVVSVSVASEVLNSAGASLLTMR